ncbi:MAG: hypothetical protein KatS3mg105_0120 [Gemmatales bacterium]|nr:MAG: hypothetical protein KatS3mg105_0120 [Gemmatales bacterium]
MVLAVVAIRVNALPTTSPAVADVSGAILSQNVNRFFRRCSSSEKGNPGGWFPSAARTQRRHFNLHIVDQTCVTKANRQCQIDFPVKRG